MELVSHVGVTGLVLGRTYTNVHACHSYVYIQTHIHVPFLRPNAIQQLVRAYTHTHQGKPNCPLCKPPLINTIQPTHSRNVKACGVCVCVHTLHIIMYHRLEAPKTTKWWQYSISLPVCKILTKWDTFSPYLESEAQCIAYILAKWPRSVFLVLKLTLLIAGTSLVTSLSVVSATAIRASCMNAHGERESRTTHIKGAHQRDMGGCALIRNPNPIAKLLWNPKKHSRKAKNIRQQ